MTARAVTNNTPNQRLPPTPSAKIIDDALPHKAEGGLRRIVVGGVSVPNNVDPDTRHVLERAERIRREKAERREKRRQIPKHPLSFEIRESRREALLRETEEAYDAVNRYSLRPKSNWRERQKWTPAQYREYVRRVAKFDARTPKPTARQWKLVERDQNRIRRESFSTDEPPPWVTGRNYVEARLSDGYYGFECDRVAGNERYLITEDFNEAYLRSTLSAVIYRFVTGTAAPGSRNRGDGPKLLSGPTKDSRRPQWTKLEGLDQEYGTLHPTMRSGWRHEIDRDYKSWDHLRRAIRKRVNKGRLACMAHVVVAYEDPDTGAIYHPHLWWFLPEGSEVLYDRDNPRANTACMDLYDGVVVGSFVALQGLGADAGGLANPVDGKLPTCPRWSFQVWNEDIFPTLKQWKDCVNVYTKRDHVVREQVIRQSDQPATRSMAAFSDGLTASREILRNAHKSRDRMYCELLEDRRELADWLWDRLDPLLSPKHPKDRNTLRRAARWIAHDWDPKKANKCENRNRGVAYAYVRDIRHRDDAGAIIAEGVTERQMIGGRVGRKVLQVKTLDLILTAMEMLDEQEKPRTLQNVTALIPQRHPRTVRRNFRLAQEDYDAGRLSDIQCLLGGLPENRPLSDPSFKPCHHTGQPFVPSPVSDHPVLTGGPGWFEYYSPERNVEVGHLLLSDQDLHSWAAAQVMPLFPSHHLSSCGPSTETPEDGTVSHLRSDVDRSSCTPSTDRTVSRGSAADPGTDDSGPERPSAAEHDPSLAETRRPDRYLPAAADPQRLGMALQGLRLGGPDHTTSPTRRCPSGRRRRRSRS